VSDGEIAIQAEGLVKTFRVYKRPMDAVIQLVTRKPRHVERTALASVDFTMFRGEVVGVLGRNGAGKSTLLRLIAGTLAKTSGLLQVNGRVTAILELGTGFHPHYTGRENIYMGGLCMGMSRLEIDAKIDTIIDYSELRSVIDQPFKTYSTGMQARLTFSTTISIDPDILIIDEALSVGDARFQAKCFRRIQELREKNATILLVSHDDNTIGACCDRAIILEKGRIFAEGTPKEVTSAYHKLLYEPTRKTIEETPLVGPQYAAEKTDENLVFRTNQDVETPVMRYGTGELRLTDWGIYDTSGNKVKLIQSGSNFSIEMTCICRSAVVDATCGFVIKDQKGIIVWGLTNVTNGESLIKCDPGDQIRFKVLGTMWLSGGDYSVTLGMAHQVDGDKIDYIEEAIFFKVSGPINTFTASVVNLDASYLAEKI
jgi:ABC-type polysaccharide/polyol phosphate transport system ATPase subunit